MAYRAPFWLWVEDEYDEDERSANALVLTPRGRATKNLFDGLAGPEWVRYAYAPQYIIARRMFAIMKSGLVSDQDHHTANNIIAMWKWLHPEDDVSGPFVSDGDCSDSGSDKDVEDDGANQIIGEVVEDPGDPKSVVKTDEKDTLNDAEMEDKADERKTGRYEAVQN